LTPKILNGKTFSGEEKEKEKEKEKLFLSF
jgi:hypothetical protein